MKKSLIILLILISTAGNSQNQKLEAQKTIKNFFIAFHAKDTLKLKEICHPKMLLQSISEGSKGIRFEEEKNTEFIKSFSSFPSDLKFEEKILSYKIQIDGTMAHAWTPYEFYINGNLSHSGVNSFTLLLDNNTWKIVHIIDTRRKNKK